MCCSSKSFIVVVSCLISLILAQNNPCTTPNNEPGDCVLFYKCEAKYDEWASYVVEKPKELMNYINQARCLKKEQGFRICCASTTPSATVSKTQPSVALKIDSNSDYTSKLNKRGFDILNSMSCGAINGDRVAYGIDANLNDFPWMALLEYDTNGYPYQCGGTLITNRYVLTAAHCVTGNILDVIGVRLGEFDISKDRDCQTKGITEKCNPNVEDFGIDQIKPHPEYVRRLFKNDIALIKLNRNVNFKVHIKPICLPLTPDSAALETEQLLLIAGWGTTEKSHSSNVLQYARVNLKEREYCQSSLKVSSNEDQLCAVGEKGEDTCRGDSGGPLFINAPYKQLSKFVQFGVVSYGHTGCGIENHSYPSVYANVVHLLPWITENID